MQYKGFKALSPTGSALGHTNLSPFARIEPPFPAIVVVFMSAHVLDLLSSWRTTTV